MSDTNTTLSGLNRVAMSSMSSSPETMPKPFLRSMTTSPKVTGIMPTWAILRIASVSVAMSFPFSMTKQFPGATDAAGIPTFMSSEVIRAPSSMASWWTMAAAATWPKSTRPFCMEYFFASTCPKEPAP